MRIGTRIGLLLLALGFVALLAALWLMHSARSEALPSLGTQQEYADYLRELAGRKGGAYAYEAMKQTTFPAGVSVHELGHIVGDVLYEQKGAAGMATCTNDFRSACEHSVVIGLFLAEGEAALADIAEVCRQAPGSRLAYTQCFHGLGHGALAYVHYDLSKALALCKSVGTPENKNREYVECSAGAVMELATGAHDRDAWREVSAQYFKEADPLSPCDASFIPEGIRSTCYLYLTPHLLEAAGVDQSAPTDASIAKAFSYCDALQSVEYRRTCYGGFGNELALMSEYRNVSALPIVADATLMRIRAHCALADDAQGTAACNSATLQLMFSGGRDEKGTALRYCALAPGLEQDACYEDYARLPKQYLSNDAVAARCSKLPEEYREACL